MTRHEEIVKHMKKILLKDIDINKLVAALKNGAVIAYPTETCYGLGCDATNQEAVNKIFEIKKRQKDKPLLVVMPDQEMAINYIIWSELLQNISQKYWPGELTCVANLKPGVEISEGVRAQDNSLAFRITSHPFVSEISQKLGKPLVSTSANISNEQSCYDVKSLQKIFEHQDVKPDIIIDAGELPERIASTIIKVIDNNIIILRQGEVIIES